MYFLQVDYIYMDGPVQRTRIIVSSYEAVRNVLINYEGTDYLVLQVNFELCV